MNGTQTAHAGEVEVELLARRRVETIQIALVPRVQRAAHQRPRRQRRHLRQIADAETVGP